MHKTNNTGVIVNGGTVGTAIGIEQKKLIPKNNVKRSISRRRRRLIIFKEFKNYGFSRNKYCQAFPSNVETN